MFFKNILFKGISQSGSYWWLAILPWWFKIFKSNMKENIFPGGASSPLASRVFLFGSLICRWHCGPVLWSCWASSTFILPFLCLRCLDFQIMRKNVLLFGEKKPIAKEKAKSTLPKLPPTLFCGVCSDTDEEQWNAEDFQSELQKVQEAQGKTVSGIPSDSVALLMAVN